MHQPLIQIIQLPASIPLYALFYDLQLTTLKEAKEKNYTPYDHTTLPSHYTLNRNNEIKYYTVTPSGYPVTVTTQIPQDYQKVQPRSTAFRTPHVHLIYHPLNHEFYAPVSQCYKKPDKNLIDLNANFQQQVNLPQNIQSLQFKPLSQYTYNISHYNLTLNKNELTIPAFIQLFKTPTVTNKKFLNFCEDSVPLNADNNKIIIRDTDGLVWSIDKENQSFTTKIKSVFDWNFDKLAISVSEKDGQYFSCICLPFDAIVTLDVKKVNLNIVRNYISVDFCENIIKLELKPKTQHLVYNNNTYTYSLFSKINNVLNWSVNGAVVVNKNEYPDENWVDILPIKNKIVLKETKTFAFVYFDDGLKCHPGVYAKKEHIVYRSNPCSKQERQKIQELKQKYNHILPKNINSIKLTDLEKFIHDFESLLKQGYQISPKITLYNKEIPVPVPESDFLKLKGLKKDIILIYDRNSKYLLSLYYPIQLENYYPHDNFNLFEALSCSLFLLPQQRTQIIEAFINSLKLTRVQKLQLISLLHQKNNLNESSE